MKHGQRHDDASKVSSCRLDGRGGYFVLRLDRNLLRSSSVFASVA